MAIQVRVSVVTCILVHKYGCTQTVHVHVSQAFTYTGITPSRQNKASVLSSDKIELLERKLHTWRQIVDLRHHPKTSIYSLSFSIQNKHSEMLTG